MDAAQPARRLDGKNRPQRVDQRGALLIGADRDAQVLVDARLLEVTHDDLALAQLGRERRRVVLRVAREDEVRRRGQNSEAERFQSRDQRRAARHDGLPRFLQVFLVGDCRRRTDDRQAVERIRVEAVLDAHQCFNQRRVADRVADAQSGEAVRLRECSSQLAVH